VAAEGQGRRPQGVPRCQGANEVVTKEKEHECLEVEQQQDDGRGKVGDKE